MQDRSFGHGAKSGGRFAGNWSWGPRGPVMSRQRRRKCAVESSPVGRGVGGPPRPAVLVVPRERSVRAVASGGRTHRTVRVFAAGCEVPDRAVEFVAGPKSRGIGGRRRDARGPGGRLGYRAAICTRRAVASTPCPGRAALLAALARIPVALLVWLACAGTGGWSSDSVHPYVLSS